MILTDNTGLFEAMFSEDKEISYEASVRFAKILAIAFSGDILTKDGKEIWNGKEWIRLLPEHR